MSGRVFPRFLLVGFCGLVLASTGSIRADDQGLDPTEPPVRLKKKNRQPREKKVEPPKDVDARKDGEARPPAPDPDKPVRPKIGDEGGQPGPKKKPAPVKDERKEIVKRILKNLEKAETKLAKNDPGRTTCEIQRDIVKDLDKLIEQTRNQPPPRGGSSRSQSRSRRSQQKSNASNSSQSARNSAKNNGGAKRNNPSEGRKKGNGNDLEDQKAGHRQNPGSKGGKGVDKSKSKLNDLFKDVWGHLPETMRQEMDAYSRAKFIPDYDLALKQYYRTLSEQGRKK
jgi:hypothetical protein